MSKRNDPAGIRLQRIQKIHKMVQNAGDADLTRLLATCEYQMGITRTRARVYLQALVDLGFVEVDEDANLVREAKKE